MESRLSLCCLGEPVLSGPDGQPIRFKVRKHLALLVFLAVEDKGRHHRDYLAQLLWANLPDGDNRHSLATALSMIRSVAGQECLETDRDHVRFNRSQMALDLDRLETGDVLASELQPALEIAGFLDGFEIPGAADFMLWRERQRARWLPLVRDALLKRIDKCRRTGDFKQIEHLGDRMLHLDELSEEAVRAKMEARAFAGDRLGALKVFEGWKERLFEDLGASPSALVEGMAIRLRRRGVDRPATSRIEAVPTDQWKDRPFVGRANEYQALYEGWERTQRGEAGHAILIGDSGIGKSTVADRLATAAGLEGAVTARVQCYDVEREIPYAAIAGFVQTLINQPGASATAPDALAELARVVPEVRQKYQTIPAAVESQGETTRILLTEAFHQFLMTLADEQPVILLLDDMHLADDASLAVIHLMMRRSQGHPIMVLFATRLDGPDLSPQAVRLRESADRLGIRIIELNPMTDDESSALLASFIAEDDPQPGAAARRALLRAAAGYPMVLELLVQDWKTNGERSVALSVDAMTADPAVANGIKGAYHQLLDRLTGSLDPATRNVLTMASILGGRLNNLPSYALADLTRGQTMSGMAELVRHRILRERGDRLEFANELIRMHVYMTVPSPLRREMHGEIAGRLLAEATDGTTRSGLEIAWHCIRGGRPAEGVPHLLSGARDALLNGGAYEVELALRSAMRELNDDQQDAANLLLAEALQEQGRPIDSLAILEGLSRKVPQADHHMIEVLTLSAHQRLSDFDGHNAGEAITRLTHLVTSSGDVRLRARALGVAALLVHDLQLRGPAQCLLGLSTANWPSDLDEETAVRLVVARALLRQVNGADDPLSELGHKVEQLRASGLANLAAVQLVHCSSAAHCSHGDYQTGLEHAQLAQQMAARIGNDLACTAAAANLALCHGRLGNYAEQGKWAAWGQQFLGKTFIGYREVRLGLAGAFSFAMLGAQEPALAALDRLASRIPAHTAPWIVQAWRLGRADVLRLCGLKREAIREAGAAMERDSLLNASCAGPYARWLVALAIAKGQTAEIESDMASMRHKLNTYEAIDQVEILASELVLLTHIGKAEPAKLRACQRRVEERLSQFPAAVSQQLSRLGALWTPR